MEVAHDSIFEEHLGIKKTKDCIQTNFYWPGMQGDVTSFCRSCDVRQKTTAKGSVPCVPPRDMLFRRAAVELVGPISPPSEEEHRYILTLVDYATRYPEAVPLKNIETETVAQVLVDMYSRLGIPEVLSDLGTQFVLKRMEEISRLLSIKRLTTMLYYPICNGLVECFNGTSPASGIVLLIPYYLHTKRRHRRPLDFHRLNYCTGGQYADQYKS